MDGIYTFFNQHFGYIAMLFLFVGWAALGLFFGRFISVWFPFMPTSRFYFLIRAKRLQNLLTSEDTLFWGRTRPKYLPEQYYLVSPANRGKISLWGVIFYAGWLVLAVLFVLDVAGQISKAVGDWLIILILSWPLLLHGLANLDYSRGFHQIAEEEKKNRQKAQPVPEQDEFSVPSEEEAPMGSVQQETPPPSSVRYRPWRFTVPLRPPAPEVSVLLIAAGMILGMASWVVLGVLMGTYPKWQRILEFLWLVVPIALIVGPPVVLAAMGRLFSTTLVVAGDQIYQQGMVRDVDLTGKIAYIRRDPSDNCYVLLDKHKKQLVKFSCKEPEGINVLDYLRDRHIPWG